jgi:AraC-like DNA-binding protein
MIINAGILRRIFDLVKDRGAYSEEQRTSISETFVSDSDLVPVTVAHEIFLPVIGTVNWSTIGLEVGASIEPLDLGILGYYLHSCPDLFTAYNRLVRYQALISDVANFHVEEDDEFIYWYLTTPMGFGFMDDRMMKVVTDLGMACRHGVVKRLVQSGLFPASVELVYNDDDPENLKALEEFYGCKAVYGQNFNKIVYRKTDVERAIPSSNAEVRRLLEPVLNSRMEELYGNKNQTQMVERLVRSNIGLMNCTLESIAFKLNMSPRNLQRRLQNEDAKFQDLLEKIQKEVALSCKQNGMVPKEIADLLGYKETNSFLRAFKRWHGVSFSQHSG